MSAPLTKRLLRSKRLEPPAAPVQAPPVEEALRALLRRDVRAVVSLLVGVVAVAILVSLLFAQSAALRQSRAVVEAAAGVLVLWPFFTAVGKNYAWRIALGRAYAHEERWADAARALAPLGRRARAQLFDATGEGTFWLACARRALGQNTEAARLFRLVARHRAGPWRERARAELAAS